MVVFNNLSVSGSLSAPIITNLGISSGVLDNKIYTLGVSAFSLGVSSSVLDNKIYTIGVSCVSLGISSGILDSKIGILGISVEY